MVSSLAMYFGNGFEKFQRYEKQPLVSLAFEIGVGVEEICRIPEARKSSSN